MEEIGRKRIVCKETSQKVDKEIWKLEFGQLNGVEMILLEAKLNGQAKFIP